MEDFTHNGRLSVLSQVLSVFLTKNMMRFKDKGQTPMTNYTVASKLMLVWVYCNVYTCQRKRICQKLDEMQNDLHYLRKVPKKKRTGVYWEKFGVFLQKSNSLFDIKCNDDSRNKIQEHFWGVKMTETEESFYKNMCKVPQVGHCLTSVSRKWQLSEKRKKIESERRIEQKRKSDADIHLSYQNVQDEENVEDMQLDISNDFEDDYVPKERKKSKYEWIDILDHPEDDLPYQYRHVRSGLRSVREEIDMVAMELASVCHMSKSQIESSICIIANRLFGREKYGKWKPFESRGTIDANTLPRMNIPVKEQRLEAMALNIIVEELMQEGNEGKIMYANDGSATSRVGNYVVQSLVINGKQRALPTLGIFSETRDNLKELEILTLNILAAACGHNYSPKDILSRITFVMTDSTAHNLGVIENVCKELEVEETPKSLVCNIHPLMMFQGKIKQFWTELHNKFGNTKLSEAFVVDVEFRNESFPAKALKCLSSFINKDTSAKPWNRQREFDQFIKPKTNKSISYKDHRFNRIFDCSLVTLHHIDDISNFLSHFTNVVNGIAILDRSFSEMEILKPIFASATVLAIHVSWPYQTLLLQEQTVYSTLLIAFSALYNDLTTVKASELLELTKVFTFVTDDVFKKSLPEESLLETLQKTIVAYRSEIETMVDILLKKFADGISTQRGAIFGFGPNADVDTGPLLKIFTVSEEEMVDLDKVPIDNLSSERSVGFFGYELGIRGKLNFDKCSRMMTINKSFELLHDSHYKKFKKQAEEIQDLKRGWDEMQKQLEKRGFEEKEVANVIRESKKLEDLEFLKSQNPAGPFTACNEVKGYVESTEEDEKKKVERLYKEVRYARKTSLSLPETAEVFRLKRNGKNLSAEEYADNLMSYLDRSRATKSLNMNDLQHVLVAMTSSEDDTDTEMEVAESIDYIPGEHVISAWRDYDGNTIAWYLGIIDEAKEDQIEITYFEKCGTTQSSWILTDKQYTTHEKQIMYRNVRVAYKNTKTIRCSIQKSVVDQCNTMIETLTF